MNKVLPRRKTGVRTHSWNRSGRKCVTLLVLAAVLLSLTAAAVNAASPAVSTTSSRAGATTHPIGYAIAGPPSMIDSGSLAYFKAHGFSTVELIATDGGTYQAELNEIKALGMQPVIDVEFVIWNGGQLESTPITSFGTYFQSLKNAGWEYVASEGGRAGDLAYMQQFFKGYINYNCNQCGLWLDVYKNPFTVMNSWESYYTPEWSSVQQGATQAAAVGIQNGIMAGLWANSHGDNPILANSLGGNTPSYKSMLDWSYANGIGFTQFCIWCSLDPHVLSDYENLGFPQLVANLQADYPPTSTAATSSPAATSPRLPTQLSITPSSGTVTAGESATFSGTLTQTSTPIRGAMVDLQVSTNNKNWELASNIPATTRANGAYTFSGALNPGTYYFRTYYPGTAQFSETFSRVIKVRVTASSTRQPTRLSISASGPAPAAGRPNTFSGTLSTIGTLTPSSLANAKVYLQVSTNNKNWELASNIPATTRANGAYTFSKSLSTGTYYFRIYYAGTSQYLETFSPTVKVYVTSPSTR